jgi:hypothetical protein
VGPRAGLDDVERRKSLPLPELKLRNFGLPDHTQSPYRLRYPGSQVFPELNELSSIHEDVYSNGGIAPPLFISALDGGEWLASLPGSLPVSKQPSVD